MHEYEIQLSNKYPDIIKSRTEQQENLKFFLIYGNDHVKFDDLHHWTMFLKLAHST